MSRRFTRRSIMAGLGAIAALPILAACQPQIIEVEKVQVVERDVPVERVVTQIIEKEIERVITVEVEKAVQVDRVVEVEKIVTVEVDRPVVVEKEALPPLIVGQLNAFTGSLSYFGTSHRNGAALAADHVNRAGGIGGGLGDHNKPRYGGEPGPRRRFRSRPCRHRERSGNRWRAGQRSYHRRGAVGHGAEAARPDIPFVHVSSDYGARR